MNILPDPGLVRSIDPVARRCEFLQVDRPTLSRMPFHDHRLGAVPRKALSMDEVQALLARSEPRSVNYIFHTAFCGSTLLARCFDEPGTSFSVREPEVLMELSNHARMRRGGMEASGNRGAALDLAARLMAAGADEGELVVIKPTNAIANLLPDVLSAPSTNAALFLYSDLKSFLISVVKKGERCRAFVRQLFNVLTLDSEFFSAIPERQRLLFTDLQVAAIVWYLQLRSYMTALGGVAAGTRVASLDSAIFFASPDTVLPAVAGLFGMDAGPEWLMRLREAGIFERDSKDSEQAYDTRLRDVEAADVEAAHGEALDEILDWSRGLQQQAGISIPEKLPSALVS